MKVAGMMTEYDPLHMGHLRLMAEARRLLGEDAGIICCMSGDFVQRGDFAVMRRQARAKAAVQSGADLVLELPLPWAVSSAEGFASGGVQVLAATGIVTHLVFGSECGESARLMRLAQALRTETFLEHLTKELKKGVSFAAARQQAVAADLPEDAEVLRGPNDILGVEYCKALLGEDASIQPLAVLRTGAPHGGEALGEGTPSASAIRRMLKQGQREAALELMAPAMAAAYQEEEAAGRAPVWGESCERAILARLRSMEEGDFAALDQGREGLYHRLYESSRRACSLEEVLQGAKTKRFAYARLRRMSLWAYLGLRVGECPKRVPYLRVLAANGRGRRLLGEMRKSAALPVVTKPAAVRRLGETARQVISWEARAADLYALAYPDLSAAVGGSLWREGPAIL